MPKRRLQPYSALRRRVSWGVSFRRILARRLLLWSVIVRIRIRWMCVCWFLMLLWVFTFFFVPFFLVGKNGNWNHNQKQKKSIKNQKHPIFSPTHPSLTTLSSPPGNRNPRPLRLRLHLRNLHSRRSHHHRRILRPRRSLRKFHRSDLYRIRIRLHRRSFHFFCHCGDDYG